MSAISRHYSFDSRMLLWLSLTRSFLYELILSYLISLILHWISKLLWKIQTLFVLFYFIFILHFISLIWLITKFFWKILQWIFDYNSQIQGILEFFLHFLKLINFVRILIYLNYFWFSWYLFWIHKNLFLFCKIHTSLI